MLELEIKMKYTLTGKIDPKNDGTLGWYLEKYEVSARVEYLEADDLELESLEGGSELYIEKHFSCVRNKLFNLIGGPQEFGPNGIYYAGANEHLISLEGAPLKIYNFYSDNNRSLISLEGIGRKYLKEVKNLNLNRCPIFKNILGLCLIKNLTMLVSEQKEIRKMLGFKGEVLEAQEWLIENGYKQFAKL